MAPKYCRCLQSGLILETFLDREAYLFCQIAWLSIGLSSWRFRQAWIKQKRPLDELKFRASWTWPWGPPFVVSLSQSNYPCLNGRLIPGGIRFHSYLKCLDLSLCALKSFSDSMVLQYKGGLPSSQRSRWLILSPSTLRSQLWWLCSSHGCF